MLRLRCKVTPDLLRSSSDYLAHQVHAARAVTTCSRAPSNSQRVWHSSNAVRRLPAQRRVAGQKRLSHSASIAKPLTPIHTLSELEPNSRVVVAGWLGSIRRVSKALAFAVLHFPRGQGQIQVIASSTKDGNDVADIWERAGLNGVVLVEGSVQRKPVEALREGQSSSPLAQLEIRASHCVVLNAVAPGSLPFNPLEKKSASVRDEIRMQHRPLDLRSATLGNNIRLRSKVSQAIRTRLHAQDFTEIETPTLLRSTPEGAREYLVPTRTRSAQDSENGLSLQPQFYALQQSPQQPKQLLVISGVTDRYFQLARCFRDEDGRKDRQPEFTQVDIEMSYIQSSNTLALQDDWTIGGREVRAVIEDLIRAIWQAAGRDNELGPNKHDSFRVMRYKDAMEQYGSDKPDLRYGMKITSLGQVLRPVSYEDATDESLPEFRREIEILSVTPPPGALSTSLLDEIFLKNGDTLDGIERFRTGAGDFNVAAKLLLRKSRIVREHLGGLAGEVNATDIPVDELRAQLEHAHVCGRITSGLQQGDKTWTFVASRRATPQGASTKLGELRCLLAQHFADSDVLLLATIPPQFLWVIEFPLFTRADADKSALSGNRWSSSHHPFTSPKDEDIARVNELLSDELCGTHSQRFRSPADEAFLASVVGQHYDLVLNGIEIGGGSVRIHDAELQRRILANMLQLRSDEMTRFSHLLHALSIGAPPHAGIALGLDRLLAILCDTRTIRDVVAFPKSASGRDLLFGSPDALSVPLADVHSPESHRPTNEDASKVKTADDILAQYGLRTL